MIINTGCTLCYKLMSDHGMPDLRGPACILSLTEKCEVRIPQSLTLLRTSIENHFFRESVKVTVYVGRKYCNI